MPQLALAEALQDGTPLLQRIRGFSVECWADLLEVKAIARRAGLEDKPLPSRILHVGPCPGRWRLYYAIVEPLSPGAKPLPAGFGTLLGRRTDSHDETQL
jgi:hypothetical protein